MKLKKLLIITLSFILVSMCLITSLPPPSTVSLEKYNFNNRKTPEITMTKTYSKIIFIAYFDNGEEMYLYADKNIVKFYLNGGNVSITGYRYTNYRATIKMAGKNFSGLSGKYSD